MICNIPEGSGQVNIGLIDAVLQGSNALRHMTELYDILVHTEKNHSFLMLRTCLLL